MKTLHLRWMAAALTAALCLTVLIATQTHPAQAQAINCADTATTGIPQAECQLLIAKIKPLVPEWDQDKAPCQWTGVHCENGHVLAIYSPNAYNPSIPTAFPDLSGLTHLEYLELNCPCSGSFPAWIAASPILKMVKIGWSQLNGPLPDLSAMVALEELNLYDNEFSGPLPDISMLPNLKTLDVSGNNFSGTLHSGITASTSLQILDIRSNALSGPLPDLSPMSSLAIFDAANNQFSGPLPALPPNITLISLAVNRLTGGIPANYADLQGGYLYLSGNMLTGEVPPNLHIMNPYLSYNALTVTDPEMSTWLELTNTNSGNPKFFETQTIPPTGISASNVTHDSADVSWTPILYTADTGSYEVGLSTTTGSGYVFNHSTANKSASGITLTGLTPNTTYYGVIRTVTLPHDEDPDAYPFSALANPNTVTSQNSAEFTFTTGFDPDVFNCANTAATGIPQTECEALVAVFPDRTENVSPCTWGGITCTGGHVTDVAFWEGGLTGNVPDFSALTHLEELELWSNALTGGFPAWIASSSTLRIVLLDNNALSGPLPDLSAMTSLEQLGVGNNNFSGPLPDLAGLTTLQFLYVGGNQFTGPLPDTSQMPNLHTLVASNNNFTGTINAGIKGLTSLFHLAVDNNNLSGPLPDMRSMSGLIIFDASGNDLSGELPAEWPFPSGLETVDLSHNHFSGSIPASYAASLPDWLHLDGNMLSGDVPNAPDGHAIEASYNALSNASQNTQTLPPTGVVASNVTHNSATVSWTPIAYTADTGAYEVGLSTTSGSGYVFNHVTADKLASGISLSGLALNTTYYAVVRTVTQPHAQNPNTVTSLNSAEFTFTTGFDPDALNCANTAVTGIPQAECEVLVALVNTYGADHFPSNWLSNTSPCTWSNLGCKDGHITGFDSVSSEFGGPIPDLSALTHLSWLNLRWENFSGSIPAWITESTTLEFLDLGGNQLSGELPDFSAMTSLRWLFLYKNDFSGGFPTGVDHVMSLVLSGNQLSGPIPDLDGTALRGIELSDNNFTGNLPQVHPETEIINFARNSLTGVIPTSYGSLLALDNIDLSGNDLYGLIPKSIGNLPLLGVYTQDGQAVNFSHNRLSASGSALIAKLTAENPDFFTTQTLPPTGVAVSNVTPTSADLSWTPILYTADTGAYEIGLSTTSGSGYVFNHSTANKSASAITLSGLAPQTTYYVVVRTVTQPHAQNPNTVTSLNSAEISFTTAVDPVSAPVLLSPTANGVVRGTNSPVLSWLPNPAGEGVTAYQLMLKNDATGAKILKQTFPAASCAAVCAVDLSSLAPQVDLALGVYNWQVTATGSLGTTKSLKQKFSLVKPDAPVITAPLGTVSDPQPDLTWTVNPDDLNTGYKLKLVGVKSGLIVKKTVSGVCSGAACAIGLDTLAGGPIVLNNDSYTLTVKAINEIGGRKATGTFKVKFPAPAVNLAPADGLIVNTPHPVLSWMPDPNASSFRVILQKIKNGAVVKTFKVSNIVNGTQGFVCSAGTCTLDLASLASPLALPKGNYVWTVVSSSPAIHPTSTSKSAKAKFKVVLP